ncbi:MAG: transglycosylase domain-containing protein [Actinomycetota bacterium]
MKRRAPMRPILIALAFSCAAAACSLSPVELEAQKPLALRSTITASDGTVLARLFRENRALVDIEGMPEHLIDAVLAAEDQRFFQHEGFDIRAIVRAALVNIGRGEVVQGGSTITQQYVKNTFFRNPEKTFERKARELRLALEVERQYSKREILERYLNTVYLGEGAYGVKAGAETYFGHGVGGLSLEDSALLAAMIRFPARYDPREHPRRALARRNYVIDRLEALKWLSPAQAASARARPIEVSPAPRRIATKQPYFVEAVKQEILSDRRLGQSEAQRAGALWKGGLHVETTLVPEYQEAAEHAVRDVLDQKGDPEAALVAIRPSTGEIVAMVGGRDFSVSQVNLALGRGGGGSGRQTGSAFKPLVLAAALEGGITLDARYAAGPAVFTFENADPWPVSNSEGTAGGTLPLDEATVRSVNGVFARLALQLGAGRIATQAELMGVKASLPSYPSIALGSAEVSVLDMAAAYATLANNGTAVEPTTIREVRLANGEILHPQQKTVISAVAPGNAYLISKVLQQVIERGTGTAADIGRPAAGKTGTTNDYTDAWFVGYTPDLVTAVWVGYPHGTIPMTNVHGIRVFGGTFPALIWRNFMLRALEDIPPRPFRLPRSDVITVLIDPRSGLLAAPWCPGKPKTMLRQLAPRSYCPAPAPEVFEPGTDVPIDQREGPGRSPTAEPEPEDSPEPKPSKTSEPEPEPEPSPEPEPEPSPTPSGNSRP